MGHTVSDVKNSVNVVTSLEETGKVSAKTYPLDNGIAVSWRASDGKRLPLVALEKAMKELEEINEWLAAARHESGI